MQQARGDSAKDPSKLRMDRPRCHMIREKNKFLRIA